MAGRVPAGGVLISDVTATGPTNAWAFGENDRHGHRSLLLHWNGSHWRPISYPGEGSFLPNALYAVSPTDFWLAQQNSVPSTSMLHWHHGTWSRLQLPPDAFPMLVLGDASIWIEIQSTGPGTACPDIVPPNPGPACDPAAHWNGSTWTSYAVPAFGPLNAWASSPSNIWLTANAKLYPREPSFRSAVFRWTGASWRRVSLSTKRMWWPSPILTYSPRNVYVDAASTAHPGACAMHWNGRGWSPVYLRGNEGACGLTPDYRHGF